jgi:hypothetical protein
MQFLRNDARAICLCAALLLLAGCGVSSQSAATIPHWSSAVGQANLHGKSRMLPGSSSGDLIYAPGGCGGVCVVSFPSLKLVGSLATLGNGVCTDSQGNVFFPSGATVTEYAHGGTQPIATLTLGGNQAQGCSVDPATNSLAVVYKGSAGDIAVFANEQGNPNLYDSQIDSSYCAYDNDGNLFVDGMNNQQPGFSELLKGASQFTELSIPDSVGLPGQVQWDGSYITYESYDQSPQISRLSISGSAARVVGTTKFKSIPHYSYPSWIYGSQVFVPYDNHGIRANVIGVWKYPKGGRPTKTVRTFPPYRKHLIDFTGVALSVQP